MAGESAHPKWVVPATDLVDLTPEKARELIVRCFLEAQKETFARARERLGQIPTEAALLANVEGAVRLAFRESGGDFDRPTAQSLEKVVEVLARKAGSWGTPEDVIHHHKGQIGRVLSVLAGGAVRP
ncbi:MAG: hypothetical protein AB1347_06615 [Acidobacteriota bacterium]